jgi:hypothetical protein
MPRYSLDAPVGNLSPTAEYTIQRLENIVGSVNGTPLQPVLRKGFGVQPVHGLKAVATTALGAESSQIVLRFFEPDRLHRFTSNYNIYVKFLNDSQDWQLAHTCKNSIFSLLPSTSGNVVVLAVQTALDNGQKLKLAQCPTTSVELI